MPETDRFPPIATDDAGRIIPMTPAEIEARMDAMGRVLERVNPVAPIRCFEMRGAGANHFVIEANGMMLCQPVELNDPHSRIRFAQDFAGDRRWTVSIVPPGGIGRYELASPATMRLPGPL